MRKLLLVLLLVATPVWAQAWDVDVYLNGTGVGEVPARVVEGRVYVDGRALAQTLHVPLGGSGEQVTLNGKPIGRVRSLNQVPFLDVVDTIVALGLKGELREEGGTLALWTADSPVHPVALDVTLVHSERSNAAAPGTESRVFTIAARNRGTLPVTLTDEQICVVDGDDEIYDCETDVSTVVQPGQSAQLERLTFTVPARADLKTLVVLIGDLEVARIRL